MSEKQEKILILADRANRDLSTAAVLMDNKDHEYHSSSICFHCQQCIEKYLKTFLIYKEVAAPRTHDLLYLSALCSDFDDHFKSFDLTDFSSYGVGIRYDEPPPTTSDAIQAFEVAKIVAEYVKTKVLI